MRIFLLLSWLALMVTATLAWDKEDHEIFDLVSAVEASEGKGTTFYSWLNVPPSASMSEIGKAYRKMSMQLHPDKNPNTKKIQERFARLGVVATILRNKESRKRYDFFYKNGVPKWRGTGYYYSRYRPGLGSVLVFLAILTSGLQYIIQGLNHKKDLERIEKFIREARAAAWGQKMLPVEGQRKVKVNLGGPRRIDEDGNPVAGKTVDMVVDGQDVFILDPSGEMHLLDTSAATPPSLSRVWIVTLFHFLLQKVKGNSKGLDSNNEPGDDDDDSSSTASDATGSGAVTPNGSARLRPTSMAGGRRRKTQRKR